MPLRGVPRIISPSLLKILAEMGHGDELLLADCNFPAQSIAEAAKSTVRCLHDMSGDNVSLLNAILVLLPLDQYVDSPAAIMDRVPADKEANLPVPIYAEFQKTLDTVGVEGKDTVKMELVERFAFYERAKKCFAVVQTGEKRQYANIIIKKGCLRENEK